MKVFAMCVIYTTDGEPFKHKQVYAAIGSILSLLDNLKAEKANVVSVFPASYVPN